MTDKMKTAAIIAEYNPFHNGHAHQIRTLKAELGFDRVIVIMSPDFVQRGEPSVTGMYDRARAALPGGADAVLALPVCLATGSAQYFAEGAVRILDSLGCVDALCFGCETPDLTLLTETAAALDEEGPEFRTALRRELNAGLTFPAAREKALLASRLVSEPVFQERAAGPILRGLSDEAGRDHESPVFPETEPAALHDLLSRPNNILALEYVRALRRLHSDIAPLPILRAGSEYHDPGVPDPAQAGVFPSAAALRALIRDRSGGSLTLISPFIPEASLQALGDALNAGRTPCPGRYDLLMRHALLAFAKSPDPGIQDMGPDLARRIAAGLEHFQTAETFAGKIHSKNLTCSRVRRALLHLLLGIPQSLPDALLGKDTRPGPAPEGRAASPDRTETGQMQTKIQFEMREQQQQNKTALPEAVLYTQLIGFRKAASPLLAQMKKGSRIPIITRPASARVLLQGAPLASFETDMHAQDVYALLCDAPSSIHAGYRRSPVII